MEKKSKWLRSTTRSNADINILLSIRVVGEWYEYLKNGLFMFEKYTDKPFQKLENIISI